MPLIAGTCLGPYEILASLGAGGMGEVYRARDTRLNREVALKVLPEDFARDPARRRRFEQEARAVAALNHPNIVGIYDVGEDFLVTELVDGQTLRHAGKFSQRRAIGLAVQIAEGLAAAHTAGIAHRDLKPENIMIARDGRAKILDFGLAKMTRPPSPDSPASQATTQTQEGLIMGTAGYMSPEQVRGQPADYRSDIFSFGLVLYEMLAGRRAFRGATTVEIMNAILKEDPAGLPDSIGRELKRIVERCIEKNPESRFQSARDLAFALGTPLASGPQPASAASSRLRGRGLMISAGVIAIAAIAVGASYTLWHTATLWNTAAARTWTGVMLGGPEMALDPRLSPDGHLLAFQAMVDGLTQVAVMKPESGNWSILTRDRSHGKVGSVSWSPDGALIYYSRSNGVTREVYSVPVLGGDERLVLDKAGSVEALPDGSLIAGLADLERKRRLDHFWPGTGKLQELPFLLEFSPSQNTASRAYPDGRSVLVWGEPNGQPAPALGLYAVDLSTGSAKRLTRPGFNASDITGFAVSADGKSIIVSVNSGTLTRIISPSGQRRGNRDSSIHGHQYGLVLGCRSRRKCVCQYAGPSFGPGAIRD